MFAWGESALPCKMTADRMNYHLTLTRSKTILQAKRLSQCRFALSIFCGLGLTAGQPGLVTSVADQCPAPPTTGPRPLVVYDVTTWG
ncbi:hypothetical protein RRG08_050102 [Elysia crispata]|uniref:Uncharacterized protein n=1 Tax=Elysia crispata TaxID=231223 RepID=A0AAE0Z631_9GAST|nr:hypothetical protein RRG08_050102 [Elysia crispata]